MNSPVVQNQNQLLMLRKQKNLSQKRVAALLGLRDPLTLSRYERGRVLPQFVTALKMQALYGLPVHVMFAGLYAELKSEMVSKLDDQAFGSKVKED
ncbi:MAG: helix-turn-helix transcriptional regulator [Ktedonobacteraceae bacterium]|nr:helix-turn-helix transcriptional regulator [Ktedonobacteraceae bacterium]